MIRLRCLPLFLLCIGCDEADPQALKDAGAAPQDATAQDSAAQDAQPDPDLGFGDPDSGIPDSGIPDSGIPDSGSTDAGFPDAETYDGAIDCTGNPPLFPSFDRSCVDDTDCTIGERQINCCGTMAVTGIAVGEGDRFRDAAAICQQQYPLCGCPAGPTEADDGSTFDYLTGLPAVVTCNHNVCQTAFPSTIDNSCGPSGLTCDPQSEICVAQEPVGPSIQYSCMALPSGCLVNRSCTCAGLSLCTGAFDICLERGPNSITCVCPAC